MEVEEPSEKVEISDARGEPERKTVNGATKQVIKNEDQVLKEEEKETDEKADSERTRAVHTYCWEDLNALKDTPASLLWPAFIEDDCVRNGVWDPEVWHHTPASAKRCASPVEDFKRQLIIEDGIVLSPQRQSFGQGCHVPQSAPERGSQQERSKSMLSRTIERDTRDGRSRLTGRVGRGSRSLDYRANMRDNRTTRNGDPRQTSPWEKDRNEKEFKRNNEDGYSYKKAKKRYEEPEPEWVTYGPTSQLETIELRGFNKEEMFGKRSSFTGSNNNSVSKRKEKEQKEKEKNKDPSNEKDYNQDFDINQFFVSDAFLQFSDVPEKSNSNASRFCQFFGVGEGRDGRRRSSTADELLEYSGLSSGSPSTPRSPSPSQNFMFTPIKQVEANTDPENLAEMLQKTKIDVKPLLDTVLSSGKSDMSRVKGQCRLEDIEKTAKNADEQAPLPVNQEDAQIVKNTGGQDMAAFFKLVETMKTSGHLPDKPQPVIPGLPSHLLPRPPSPKSKPKRRSPSPLQKRQRSPSPIEVLHHMLLARQVPSPPGIPSPPQVVPQMDRQYSPYGTPMHKSIEMLRRTPSPVNSMYDQRKGFSPLLTPDAFSSPSPMHQHAQTRGSPRHHFIEKPYFELPSELSAKQPYKTPRQTPKPNNIITPKNQSSALRDLAFMPTSVLQKIKKDQMTPKSKPDMDESMRERIENGVKDTNENTTFKPHMSHVDKQARQSMQPLSPNMSEQYPSGKEQPKSMFRPFSNETTLLKPTAFKPYTGMSPHSVSPLRSGVHSEPQSPVSSRTPMSPSHNRVPMPSSAPATPQRHPHAEHQILLNSMSQFKHLNNDATSRLEDFQRNNERSSKSIIQEKPPSGNIDGGMIPSSHRGKVPEETTNFVNEFLLQNEIADQRARQDHEQRHQHAMQQQYQRDVHNYNYNNLYRNRPTPHMMGGRVSPQSILGSPLLPRTPYNTPIPNMHPQGKQGVHPGMMRPPIRPPYLRMMPPPARIPGMPLQSTSSLMQMMPQHPMMYGPGHTPMPAHHGYGSMNPPMMPPSTNYPGPRHPGFMHHQGGKVPSVMSQQPESNPRRSPNDSILSKWFGDEVLRGTQAPTKIPSAHDKKVMSVEDLERQQSMFTALTL